MLSLSISWCWEGWSSRSRRQQDGNTAGWWRGWSAAASRFLLNASNLARISIFQPKWRHGSGRLKGTMSDGRRCSQGEVRWSHACASGNSLWGRYPACPHDAPCGYPRCGWPSVYISSTAKYHCNCSWSVPRIQSTCSVIPEALEVSFLQWLND